MPPRLTMWYRVVCIDGIGVLLIVFSWWHKWNIWFLYFNFFISLWWYGQFFSNFKNENFHFKFQKLKFNFFHFLVVVWPIFFQNSKTKKFISNFKNGSFQNFHGGINEFFSTWGCQIYLRFTKVIHLPLKSRITELIRSRWWCVFCRRVTMFACVRPAHATALL
jgi:hypothetical protein